MADRQEFIRNAVAFLTDPKTQVSPLAQRVQFLEAKGLTGSEIEQAMRQANSSAPYPQHLQQPSYGPVYGPAPYVPPQNQPWDWRDYFITAVISGSIAYGAVAVARKYLLPHLRPPTSSAYEQDRDALTAQFDAAEALLKDIRAETSAVKAAVASQQERVDKVTADVEAAAQQMREGESRARDEMREIREEVNNIREMLPKMIEKNKEAQTQSLGELQQDLKSLKTLLLSRAPGTSAPTPPLPTFPPRPSIPSWQLTGSLRASFTIGDVSNPSTPSASSRVSPVPQPATEHPLSPALDHPLSPTSVPLPNSPPFDDHALPSLDASQLLLDSDATQPAPPSAPSGSDSELESVEHEPARTSEPEPDAQVMAQTVAFPDHSTSSLLPEQESEASGEHPAIQDVAETAEPSYTPAAKNPEADPVIEKMQDIGQETDSSGGSTVGSTVPIFKPQDTSFTSNGVEALENRLKLMEQQFADISASFAKLQAEKQAAAKVLQDLTSVQGWQDVDALRDYLQNSQLKSEMSQDEIKRLTGKLTRQDERIEELRETHRLESRSQIDLVDQLRSQMQQSDALLKASQSSNSQLEADVTKQKGEMEQLRAEVDKLNGLAKDEEEKRNKAVSLLKTVRQKLVKAEKDRDDAIKEATALREAQKAEHDKEQLDRDRLQGEINKLKADKESTLASLVAQHEKDLITHEQRHDKELAVLGNQFELESVMMKSSHEQALSDRDAQIGRLEKSAQSLSAEKDNLFDQLQVRQAEIESSQSLLEVLQGQNTELQYQIREKDDRIALLMEEVNDARQEQRVGVSDPSTSAEEVAKLLAAAETRHEAKLAMLKQELAAVEAERLEADAEWTLKLSAKVQEAQRWKAVVEAASQDRQDEDGRTQELHAEVERLRMAARVHDHEVSELKSQIEHLAHDEGIARQQLSEQVKKISALDQQLEEAKAKELQARTHNKACSRTLREELRKVQSSAALLDRQRGPGVGYWSSASAPDNNASSPSLASAASQPASSPRPSSPVTKTNDEDVNLEYLRNVILQFLEHKEMRPNLVRVLSTILRFTPQETRRLIAKV
ncbi:peroxisomal membrane anchor protein conserved region-domain-containing protein [Gloeopeniophorella convolvens]|nr:peroxisomal membrane anchor protein conserved region-domain-containing protein [Gloeopeniophorella convolvens]